MENKINVLDVLDEVQDLELLTVDDTLETKTDAKAEEIQISSIGIESPELIERQKKAKAKSLKNKNEESYRQLLRFKDMKTILWSEVDAVEMDGNLNMIGIIAYWNGLRVLIPDVMYFEPNFRFPNKYYDAGTSAYEKLNLKRRVATYQTRAKICFTIQNITHEKQKDGSYKYGIIGNRVDAMRRLRDVFFLHKDYNVGLPVKVTKGAIADAHILSVTPYGALAECLGVEVRLDSYALSNGLVEDCTEVVQPGDSLKVRVRNYRVNDDETVSLYLSGRMNKPSEEIELMKKNSTYSGVVTSYNKEKQRYTVRLNSGVNAFIKEHNVVGGKLLSVGDEVVVLVTYVGKENVGGTVLRVH